MSSKEELNARFKEACDVYIQALGQRSSNRSNKELVKGNTRGTTIHKFQTQFAWIIHDIDTSIPQLLEINTERAYDLINHILNAASGTNE